MNKAAVLFAAFGLSSSLAAQGSPDTPILVRGKPLDRALFSPVGIVVLRHRVGHEEVRTYSTAFLISNCHALTARRVFENDRSVSGRWIEYWGGVQGDVSGWKGSIAQVVAEGTPNPEEAISGQDWVLLRLEKCLGKKFGSISLDNNPPHLEIPYVLASFPTDDTLADGVNLDRRCRVRRIENGVAIHTCASRVGESGSPIVRIAEVNGRRQLVLIAMATSNQLPPTALQNSLERRFNVQPANVAIPAASLVANVQIASASRSRRQ